MEASRLIQGRVVTWPRVRHPRVPRGPALTASVLFFLCASTPSVRAEPASPDVRIPVCRDCNVVFIAVDTLRADYDTLLDRAASLMPTVDRLAARGIRFTQATAASSWTLPSAMSWMTGVSPSRHRVTNKFPIQSSGAGEGDVPTNLKRRSPRLVTLAEVFRDGGYRTAGFTGGAGVDHEFGFDVGFESYFDAVRFGGFRDTVPRALEWVREHREERLFVFLHGYECHGQHALDGGLEHRYTPQPYHGPYTGSPAEQKILRQQGLEQGRLSLPPEDVAFWKGVYAERVERADEELSRFLERYEQLGLMGKTIFVITSDHGEELMEHGRLDHGPTLYEEIVRVPLIFVIPGLTEPMRIDRQVRAIDIFPTLLALTGMESSEALRAQLQGTSVFDADDRMRDALIETSYRYYTFQKALRRGGPDPWKLILDLESDTRELFDLSRDPLERHTLHAREPAVTGEFEARLMRWFEPLTDVSQLIVREKQIRTVPCPDCHVILISIDTLRADALPCYGYERNTAPNLCAFADENILFTKPFAQASYTLPSHFSMFTSLYPSSHGVITPLKDRLHPDITTLPEVFQANGYETIFAGRLNSLYIPLQRGIERGFDVLFPVTDGTLDHKPPLSGWEEAYRRLLDNARRGQRTLLFLHTLAVHAPFFMDGKTDRLFTTDEYDQLPMNAEEFWAFSSGFPRFVLQDLEERIVASDNEESLNRYLATYRAMKKAETLQETKEVFEQMPEHDRASLYLRWYPERLDVHDPRQVAYLRALYDERIYVLDQALRSFFDLLSNEALAGQTVVVITADHGEEFGEHGRWGHARTLYNDTTHVPLIMSVPGIEGRRVDELASVIDIFPTLLGLVGLESPPKVEGIDLTGLLLNDPHARRNDYVISELRGDLARSIGDSRWKLYAQHHLGTMELYDYVADPHEQRNVAKEHQEVVAKLSGALQSFLERKHTFSQLDESFPRWLDAVKRKQLIEGGYF